MPIRVTNQDVKLAGKPRQGFPQVGLLFDGAKTLYGTTFFGGAYSYGVVFNLTANSDGSWTDHLLHTFASQLGADPHTLLFDGAGNLYGSTFYGGIADAGSIFKLVPNSNRGWTYQVLHVFQGNADYAGRYWRELPSGFFSGQPIEYPTGS